MRPGMGSISESSLVRLRVRAAARPLQSGPCREYHAHLNPPGHSRPIYRTVSPGGNVLANLRSLTMTNRRRRLTFSSWCLPSAI